MIVRAAITTRYGRFSFLPLNMILKKFDVYLRYLYVFSVGSSSTMYIETRFWRLETMIPNAVLNDLFEGHSDLAEERTGTSERIIKYADVPLTEDTYPANLLSAVLRVGESGSTDAVELFSIWDYDMNSFFQIVFKLPEREQRILDYRYRYGKTLQFIGSVMGLTRQRVMQIEEKTLKLLFLKLPNIRIVPRTEYMKVLRENQELKQTIETLKKEKEKPVPTAVVAEPHNSADPYNESIDILDLSTRPYNCLKLAGINTISDVIRFDTENGKWYALRNLGVGSVREIERKMKSMYGYALKGKLTGYTK